MADTGSFRLFYALCNKRPDGSPALSFGIEKFEALLDLGDHGTLFRLHGIYTKEDGSDAKRYFAPQDPAVWKPGQVSGAVMRIVMDAAERGELKGPSAPVIAKPKAAKAV